MIPKIIHYCWFGGKEKPKLAQKCIASWKKYCPDYQLIEWNESNFDVNCCRYVKEAYEACKYAFITDYVRLYAMYHFGGIYMDTDVEVVRSLDSFLEERAFSGFESACYVPTGIMASEKGLPIIESLLSDYRNRRFVNADGSYDMTTNCTAITKHLLEKGLVLNNCKQIVAEITLYPSEFFCPFNNSTGVLSKTENSATIHWFNKSWLSPQVRIRSKISRPFHKLFGVNCFQWIKKFLRDI